MFIIGSFLLVEKITIIFYNLYMNKLLKKKYTKKQLKKYYSKYRSNVGLGKNLFQVEFKSDKYYNRQKLKLEVKKYD